MRLVGYLSSQIQRAHVEWLLNNIQSSFTDWNPHVALVKIGHVRSLYLATSKWQSALLQKGIKTCSVPLLQTYMALSSRLS